MSYVQTVVQNNADSEREEGEIVDELDDLSDISSEEEFLLRQRLQVLENYNNVLERKKAKRSSFGSAKKQEDEIFLHLSDISEDELHNRFSHSVNKISKRKSIRKPLHKKRKKAPAPELFEKISRNKDYKKKHHRPKKRKTVSESSEESNDEYRNKRRKLANAVAVNKDKNDSSTLKARINKMLNGSQDTVVESVIVNNENSLVYKQVSQLQNLDSVNLTDNNVPKSCTSGDIVEKDQKIENTTEQTLTELIDLCTDEEVTLKESVDTVDSIVEDVKVVVKTIEINSDEDLELLREHALKSKSSKNIPLPPDSQESVIKTHNLSEDEDSDTAELRMICLKSALLKKAIERKKKQKLQKRLSHSLHEELTKDADINPSKQDLGNNTDIESVDMELGSDGDDKTKDDLNRITTQTKEFEGQKDVVAISSKPNLYISDELDEDEDLLRAKLLTSLSKNLPNLVDPNIIIGLNEKTQQKVEPGFENNLKSGTEEKRFIINLNESDSEGEHEATKNLTKMHLKLSEQVDFQQKLDLFLKSTRSQVENNKLPDVIKNPPFLVKPPEKFIPKAVNHLPKSEQLEYKNLVKKMAELERLKEARQFAINSTSRVSAKETLKPRNVSTDISKPLDNLDEQIALSRKKIAEESSKILQLKQEAVKLTQKYKIVATELKNITTAIALNKKQQRATQNKLAKIRSQHQTFLKRSSNNIVNSLPIYPSNKFASSNKLQKENNPAKDEYKNTEVLKNLRISVANDLKNDVPPNSRLSVQVDVNSNKKTVKVPKDAINERVVDIRNSNATNNVENIEVQKDLNLNFKEGCKTNDEEKICLKNTVSDGLNFKDNEICDYTSPLQALDYASWSEDPNGVLCPFEIGGNCKDPECQYLHPKLSTNP